MSNQTNGASSFPIISYKTAARWLDCIVVGIAFLSLLGSFYEIPVLNGSFFGYPPLKPVTCLLLLFMVLGRIFCFSQKRSGIIIFIFSMATVVGISSFIILEYLLDSDFGVDWIFAAEYPYVLADPSGRTALITALNFSFISVALLVRFFRKNLVLIWEGLLLVSLGLSFLGLIGYLFHPDVLLQAFPYKKLSIYAVCGLILLCLGSLIETPEVEIVKSILSQRIGGHIARRMILFSILALLGMNFIFISFVKLGLLQDAFAHFALVLSSFTLIGFVIWSNARRLNDFDESLSETNQLLKIANENLEAKVEEKTRQFKIESEISKIKEQDFRAIFEQAAEGILVADQYGKYIDVNKAAVEMLGYPREEILGKRLIDFIHEDQVIKSRFMDEDQLNLNKIEIEDWQLRKKNGDKLDVEITRNIYPDKRRMTFMRNVTQKQNNLRRLTFLSEISQIYNETLDFYGRLQRTAESLIPHLADICIISVFQNDKLDLAAAIHKEPEKAELLRQMALKILNLDSYNEERDFLIAGNSFFIDDTESAKYPLDVVIDKYKKCFQVLDVISYIGIPLRARGKTIGILSLARTGSSKKFNEDDFVFARALAIRCALAADNAKLYMNAIDAVRDREHILSIVSHDLKNPIFAIRLAIENLKKNAAKDDKEISEISQLVDNSISLMEKLIVDLLDFSKIEAGTFTVERTPCSPMEIARQASQILSLAVQEKKLQYNLEVNENLPEIICEKGRIIQVLSNLIGNAIKFSPPGGIVKLTVLEQKDFIVFSVSDNGPGIKEENLKFIFQQFWQSKETASLGTGLGLSIAKGIVDAHGGKIWAESIFGKGTTVSFTVPKLITEIKKIPQRQDQSLGLKDEFILLVDDSQDLRFLMRKLLEKYGAQVVDVSSVSEARNEMLKSISRPFDLIITDIDMPIESGFDLLKDVRRIYKGRKSSVIALTGFSDSEDIQNIMSAGFDLCFSKPVNMERLVSDIDILLHPKKNSELLL